MRSRNRVKRILGFAILSLAAFIVVLVGVRMKKSIMPAAVLPNPSPNVDVAIETLHLSEVKDGVKKWDLVAKRAEYDRKRDRTDLRSVKMVLFGDKEMGDVTLTSDRAEYDNKTRNVKLTGNIHAKGSGGMTFTTGRAEYDAAKAMITSDDRVTLINEQLTVEGVGMELMLKEKRARVLNDVVATIEPKDKK